MTNGWKKDDGYCGCETKRVGGYALVICEPSHYGRRGYWGFQVFDEVDEEAVEYGDYIYAMEGAWSEEAAKKIAEMWAADEI